MLCFKQTSLVFLSALFASVVLTLQSLSEQVVWFFLSLCVGVCMWVWMCISVCVCPCVCVHVCLCVCVDI